VHGDHLDDSECAPVAVNSCLTLSGGHDVKCGGWIDTHRERVERTDVLKGTRSCARKSARTLCVDMRCVHTHTLSNLILSHFFIMRARACVRACARARVHACVCASEQASKRACRCVGAWVRAVACHCVQVGLDQTKYVMKNNYAHTSLFDQWASECG
jgi:hypothetical protein